MQGNRKTDWLIRGVSGILFPALLLLLAVIPAQAGGQTGWKSALMVPGAQVLSSGTVKFTGCFTASNSGAKAWYRCSDQRRRHRVDWNTVWSRVHRNVNFRLNAPGFVYLIFTTHVDKNWPYDGGGATISKKEKNRKWKNVWLGPGLRYAMFRGNKLVSTGPYVNQPGPPALRYRIGKDGKIQFWEGIPRYGKGLYRITLTEAMFHNTNTANKTYHPCRIEYKLVFVPDKPIQSVTAASPSTPNTTQHATNGQISNTWIVNKAGNIYRLNSKMGWTHIPGKKAIDVGVGANGSVWIVGTSPVYGGYAIYRWMGDKFARVDGGAVRIDVDQNGLPWVVNSMNDIYRRVGNHWKRMPGKAVDIGIGANGSVWVIGIGRTPGGHGIWRWNGSNWDKVQGAAVRIDVDVAGNPWVVNDAGGIFKWNGKGWNRLPGLGTDITVGGGSEWVIGTNSVPGGHGIYRWNSRRRNWERIPGGAVAISAGGSPIPAAPIVHSARHSLKSGKYKAKVWVDGKLYNSTWSIKVENGNVTGLSKWPCCPSDPLRGKVTGNTIRIQRDCAGQGWNKGRIQTYTGTINGNLIQGTGTGTGLTGHKTTWTLLLNPEPGSHTVHGARFNLKSGRYKVETRVGGTLYNSNWTFLVHNGKFTGMSTWPCCPGPRTDAIKGKVTGNTVIIKRDCSGQGWNGGCIQTYTGKVKGNRIEGTAKGTGLSGYKTTWTLFLDSRTPLNFKQR
ncbi:MAG: hypothetical protein DRJ14_06700 [Acidobacteria bacterium]|nr:MAG: hypothetical protein DRJ14_06700 [Acidobacteriota bacterium]